MCSLCHDLCSSQKYRISLEREFSRELVGLCSVIFGKSRFGIPREHQRENFLEFGGICCDNNEYKTESIIYERI